MRRRVAIVPVIALFVLLLGAAMSAASNPAQGADIYGVGAGRAFAGLIEFNVSAHLRPDGTAFGHVTEEHVEIGGTNPVRLTIDVDCVRVFDLVGASTAAISGKVTKVEPENNRFGIDRGDLREVDLTDGGEPSSDLPVDGYRPHPNIDCNVGTPVSEQNVIQGNVVIKSG